MSSPVVRNRNVLKEKFDALAAALLAALASFGRRSERGSGCRTAAFMIRRRASTDSKSATSR